MSKVKFGLKNVHIFPIESVTDDAVTYGTVFPQKGAVSLTLNPAGESEPFYADDINYYEAFANDGYEGELTLALISEDFETKILGFEKDGNGAIIENADAKGNAFAMAFEFDGDVKKVRHVLYNCTASRPTIEAATKEGSNVPSMDVLTFKAKPDHVNGNVKAKIKEGQTGYDTFFTSVYQKKIGV